ncbi:hypothetical protein VULLAG_LOCUS13911 [Vulpes lagopus]
MQWSGSGASTPSAGEGAQNCTGHENMTAAHLSTFKLHDLTATYQAHLAARTLLASCQNLMSCSPEDGPSLGGTCAKHTMPDLGRCTIIPRRFTSLPEPTKKFSSPKMERCWQHLKLKIAVSPQTSRGQTAIVGHFDFRVPPGKVLLINDNTVIWAEGLSKVRAESTLRTTPTQHLPPLTTPQYLSH